MATQLLTSISTATKRPLAQKLLVVAGIITLIGGSLTGIMTAVNIGINDAFVNNWLRSFSFALLTVIPAGFLLMILMNKLAERMLTAASKTQRNIVVGIGMAVLMESLMAATTAVNTIGLSDPSLFFAAWLKGFVVALPIGLAMSLAMTLSVKPKLEKFMAS